MKKLFLAIGLFALAIVLVAVTRAALLRPAAIAAAPMTPVALDEDGAVKRFIGAIQIPTESVYHKAPNAVAMKQMRDYLEQSFPRVHATMLREVLPDGALLFTWKGRDTSLAPVVLMGHMDVVGVPAEDLPKWKHAPYSGDVADGFIWGRGTLDDKIHVMSELEAAETLIGRGFTTSRTILFAFGDDEENGGTYGAVNIVKLLQSRNVHPDFVVDEGGAIITGAISGLAQPLAVIGVAEKGMLDLELSTKGVGGHSSEPPAHTAIGELSAGIVQLEAHPFPTSIPEVEREQYATIAPYLPFSKRLVLGNLWLFERLIVHEGLKDPKMVGGFRTTTAADMIDGGFKDNALPPSAHATVNFRILPGETVASVTEHVRSLINDPGVSVTVSQDAQPRDPSPLSPIDSNGYKALQMTIHQMFPGAVVSPYLVTAATDASHYSVLTPNVYRFMALEADLSMLSMVHGLNERIAPEKYVKTVQFTVQLIQNIR
jgi:carboxypeptidase PM20D1